MKVNKKEIQRLYAMYNKAIKASEFDLSQVYNAFPTDVAGKAMEDNVLEELREIRGQLFRRYQKCTPDYIPTWYDRVFKGRKPVRNVSPALTGICYIIADCVRVRFSLNVPPTNRIIEACVKQLANTLYRVNPEAKKYNVGEIMGLTTSFHTFFPSRLRYMAEKNLGHLWYGVRISFIEEVIQSVVRERNRQRNKKELETLQESCAKLSYVATSTAAAIQSVGEAMNDVKCVVEKETPFLYDADPNCDHVIRSEWSGIKCTKCKGWYCA
mgnify:CR=1 FL=1